MLEELTELVYNYTINGQKADRDYFLAVIDIIVKYRGIQEYVNELNIIDAGKIKLFGRNCRATYDCDFNVNLCVETIERHFQTNERLKTLEESEELLLYMNLFYLKIIYHELEHAYQNFLRNNPHGLEAQILLAANNPYSREYIEYYSNLLKKYQNNLKIGFKDLLKEKYILLKECSFNKRAHALYDISPTERLAHLKSSWIIKQIYDLLNLSFINLENLLKYGVYLDAYGGYCDNMSPTITYFQKMGLNKELKKFSWYHKDEMECLRNLVSEYPYDLRLLLGLSLTYEERGRLFLKEAKLKELTLQKLP